MSNCFCSISMYNQCVNKNQKGSVMKRTFKEFYNPDYQNLWGTCTFVFDTNVLLDLYRYKDSTKETFFKVLEKIGNNKWLPYQVGYEYHKNRQNVIHSIKAKSEDLKNDTASLISSIKKNFEEIKKCSDLSKRDNERIEQALIDIEKISTKYDKKFQEKYKDLKQEDYIQEKLIELFDNKIGDNYTKEELESLYKIAKERFEKEIPPGYKDTKKDGNEKYSDYIIWSQIIDYAKTNNKCIIFVTADVKEDWWDECKGEKRCSHKLKKEFYDNVNAEFHMYTPERFIDEAMKFYDLDYSEEIIEEVKTLERPRAKYFPRYSEHEFDMRRNRDIYIIRGVVYDALRNSSSTEDFIHFLRFKYKIDFPQKVMERIDFIKNEYEYNERIHSGELNRLCQYIYRRITENLTQKKLFDYEIINNNESST